MLRLLRILVSLWFLTINLAACSLIENDRKMRESFRPAIAALEQFFKENNYYPEQLDALVPKYLAEVPKCPEEYWKSSSGYYRKKNGEYSIVCVVGIFILYPQRLEYTSEGDRWFTWD